MITRENGFFDGYQNIMVIWSLAVVAFMFLCVSFLRILQRAFLFLPSSFELYDPNEWYNGIKEDPEIHEEARRFISKKMLKGPQYKKIVLAHWMRIVGLFWLLVSNLATVCYIGPRVAFCVFEMLLLYWDILLYANISEIVSSSHSWIIFTFYFAAVVKVFVTSIYFLNPSKETLIRSKFHHSVALLFFHQLFLMFTQFKYAQEMHFISAETSEDLAILLQKKAQFLIFFSLYCMVIVTHHQFQKDSKETIAKADAVIWNFFSLSSVVYNVLILLCLKPALQLLPKKCVKVEPVQLSFIPSLDCFGHFELILAGCGSIQILLYLWIAFKSFAKN